MEQKDSWLEEALAREYLTGASATSSSTDTGDNSEAQTEKEVEKENGERRKEAERATSSMSADEVLKVLGRIAASEGCGRKDGALIMLNVGNQTDDTKIYTYILAMMDYVYHALRRGLSDGRYDVLTMKTAMDALNAAGLVKTGVSSFADFTQSMKDRLDAEEHQSDLALDDLEKAMARFQEAGKEMTTAIKKIGEIAKALEVTNALTEQVDVKARLTSLQASLTETNKRLANTANITAYHGRLRDSLRALKIGVARAELKAKQANTTGEEVEESSGSLHLDDMKRNAIVGSVDSFQRMLNLCENGRILGEEYERLACKLFHVIPGYESGTCALAYLAKQVSETNGEFEKRVNEKCHDTVRVIAKELSSFNGKERLILHQAHCGEMITMNVQVDRSKLDVIDTNEVAKSVLGAITASPADMMDPNRTPMAPVNSATTARPRPKLN